MEFVHRCHFCDWHREAASLTVSPPSCENCGCALAALPAGDWIAPTDPRRHELNAFRAHLLRVATLLGALLVAVAAARTGYGQGGLAAAVMCVGLAGLAAVVVIPSSR